MKFNFFNDSQRRNRLRFALSKGTDDDPVILHLQMSSDMDEQKNDSEGILSRSERSPEK